VLGIDLAPHEERRFADGERKVRPLAPVRDRDVYVLEALHADPTDGVHDKLCRLAFFVGAVRDAGAARVTAVVPYLCYARKDARTKPRDPVSTRYIALVLEAVGLDRIVTMDVHNPAAFENAFRIPTEHLEARWLFADHLRARLTNAEVTVVSPDPGGVKRAERFRQGLEQVLGRPVGSGFMEKHRSGDIVSGDALVGPVRGRTVLVVDDLVSTGTTLARAARACEAGGAAAVFAVATHGLFTGDAARVLGEAPFEQVVVADTIPPFRLEPDRLGGRLAVVDTAALLAEVIRRLHTGGSLVELMERS
jgi:ribose-phosphate pyrophosphokinase